MQASNHFRLHLHPRSSLLLFFPLLSLPPCHHFLSRVCTSSFIFSTRCDGVIGACYAAEAVPASLTVRRGTRRGPRAQAHPCGLEARAMLSYDNALSSVDVEGLNIRIEAFLKQGGDNTSNFGSRAHLDIRQSRRIQDNHSVASRLRRRSNTQCSAQVCVISSNLCIT